MTPERCACEKPATLCIGCDTRARTPIRRELLILQHPQEPDKELGTAAITARLLAPATLRVGLSWPNLAAALGRAEPRPTPGRWLVLYLGSGAKGPVPDAPLVVCDKNGLPLADQATALREIDGIVALDGTWSQAKALWWRNAWLLKLRRGLLRPARPSRYGKLRKEPRRECLSTLESVAAALTALGEPPAVGDSLHAAFDDLLAKARGASPTVA